MIFKGCLLFGKQDVVRLHMFSITFKECALIGKQEAANIIHKCKERALLGMQDVVRLHTFSMTFKECALSGNQDVIVLHTPACKGVAEHWLKITASVIFNSMHDILCIFTPMLQNGSMPTEGNS
eukprot:scaffold61188_cov22-Tisochrysis_lutea.AAC.2